MNSASLTISNKTFYQRLVINLLSKMDSGRLTILLPDGETMFIGNEDAAIQAHIEIKHIDFFKHCVLYGDIGFGEAYVNGWWDTDNITNVIKWFLLNIENTPGVSGSKTQAFGLNFLKIFNRLSHYTKANSKDGSKKNIAEHYDLNNDFFASFLDSSMTYSGAYFKEEGISLQEAQLAKYERLCKQLKLRSSDHVLEIGSGWGGNAIYIAKNYGCKVTTVTISKEQYEFAKQKIAAENLSDKIDIQLTDYRDLTGQFDKIISIEMLEAVGHQYLEVYFKKCHELLKKNGILGLQVITCPDSRYDSMRKGIDWIQKHIFPGSLLPSVGALNTAINNTGDLTLIDLKDMGLHYSKTLTLWKETFNQNIADVKKLGFNETFIRKWNYYFGYCEAAFAMRNISVMQLVYSRPNNPTLY